MKRKASSDRSKQPVKRRKSTQQIVRAELRKATDWKYTDRSATVNVASSGAIHSLYSNLVRGEAGKDNFQGNIVKPQGVTIKYYLNTNQSYNAVRVMLIQWFDAGTPVLTGILETNATGFGPISPTLITNKQYIRVLSDNLHVIAPTAGTAPPSTVIEGEGVAQGSIYVSGKKLRQTRYNSTSNTVQDGDLYLVMVSDDNLTTYPSVRYYSRVTFSDN